MFGFGKRKYSDDEIIRAFRGGDELPDKYLSFLYDQNRSPIYSYVLKNGGSETDGQEVLQAGIVRLFENVADGMFKQNSKLSSYLYVICRNHWINRQKKERKMVALPEDHEETLTDTGNDPLAFLEQADLSSGVSKLLNEIGDACKKLLIWSDGEGEPMKWIAEQLGFQNAQVAMNKKSKCKKALREKVRKRPEYQALVKELLGFQPVFN